RPIRGACSRRTSGEVRELLSEGGEELLAQHPAAPSGEHGHVPPSFRELLEIAPGGEQLRAHTELRGPRLCDRAELTHERRDCRIGTPACRQRRRRVRNVGLL